jgi:crotonobetainyl-CoA:carnitine CoA-transferase CaiB-like acyl-CoA transferase
MGMAKALQNVTVVEAGGRGAVAICGSLLAQMGATVITIENRDKSAKAVHRAQYSAGKLSFQPDPDSEGDQALLAKLLACGDIVLTSSDVDPAWLQVAGTKSSGNVVCDITAFGRSVTLAGRALSEVEVQAISGIMDTTGFPDGPPVPIRVPIVDVIAGSYAVVAVLAAHRVRRQRGFGQLIDMALFDAAFASLRSFLTTVLTSDNADSSRLGNRHPTVRPWNLYRSSDGFVLICAGNTFAMFERLCQLIGRPDIAPKFPTQKSRVAGTPEIDAAIESWTEQFSTAECVEKLLAVGVVSGPIVPVENYPREANLDFRGTIQRATDPVSGRDLFVPASPLRMSATPGVNLTRIPAIDGDRAEVVRVAAGLAATPAVAPTTPNVRPLQGVRIIEFGQYTTAPMCARELAHLGAEVIKVEQPSAVESRADASVSFRMTNADKRTIAIDLTNEFDVEALKRLLATADVLVENLKPGTLAKFGFTPAALKAINPRLIYCPISGFGNDSLYSKRPAFDMVITAMAGFMTVLSGDGFPLKSGISTADLMGAVFAMGAILAALDHADRTGEGQFIDLSMQDITAWLTQTTWNRALENRIEPAAIKASDGYVLIEAGAEALQEARRRAPERVPPQEAAARMNRESLAAVLMQAGLRAVPIQTVREAAMMPHTIERKLWFTMPEGGVEYPMLGSPLRLTVTPPRITHLALPMNNDREAILDELGLAPAA